MEVKDVFLLFFLTQVSILRLKPKKKKKKIIILTFTIIGVSNYIHMARLFDLLPKYISQDGLNALKSYKYSAEDHSILKKLFLGRYWDFVASYLPSWMAYVLYLISSFLLIYPFILKA